LANHKSSIKRNKQSIKRRERNRTDKAALRTVIKKFNNTVTKDVVEAKSILAEAVPAIAKAGSKGVIHKKNAARRISRLTKKLNKAVSATGA